MRHAIRALRARYREDHAAHNGEDGFVAVFISLLLVVMLIFAAFTVDFGSWYTRSAEIKRAADAAALAGVVWMPEFDQAQQYALAAAARNGFVNGEHDVTVSVEDVPNNNRQLKVTIRDNNAKQFFSRLVTQSQSIGQSSLAEYVLPVPLGSPKNTIGTGDLLSGGDRENFWAAVSGYCSGHESGDKKLSRNESYNTSSNSTCNNGSPQNDDDYDPDGYLYAIDLPQNSTSLKLDVYDGEFTNDKCSKSDSSLIGDDNDCGEYTSQNITTTFTIYDRNPTPLDLSNLTQLTTVTINPRTSSSSSSYENQWRNLYTWSNPKAGQYYVKVATTPATTQSKGSNGFGLRAYTGGSFATCTTISGQSGYSASCPQLHAVSDLSIFANISSTSPTFYLAQIDSIHAGKTMRINLFDSGEGASSLQILDPNGNPKAFAWSTPCNPPTPPSGACSGTATGTDPKLDVSGTGTQPYTGLNSTSKYNDRYITIDIPLPSNYTAVYGTKTWWKVKYNVSSDTTDRTTWSVNIVGDPVHLLN
jgi:Flp pilus assembly protein TadG